MKEFDIAIIGAGWAGFNAARAARARGMSACIIERSQVGGTCLNRGCIPTKSLIRCAKTYSLCQKAKRFGVDASGVRVDWHSMQAYKQGIVSGLRTGMRSQLAGVEWIPAEARFVSAEVLAAGNEQIKARHSIIASGSVPQDLPFLQFDHRAVLSSDDLLEIEKIPESLLIVGGGVIGCEFASLFGGLGTSVTVVEKEAQLLPGMDPQAARKLENSFRKRGITVRTSADARQFQPRDFSLTLVAVGRRPDLASLSLEKAGVRVEGGVIAVDARCRTSAQNIYAVGDCRGGLMLAHFAAYQGILAVRAIQGGTRELSSDTVPSCVFTHPEIAVVGLSEQQTQERGIKARRYTFDFLGSGMARIMDETDGFLTIVTDEGSGAVLGATVVGPYATELVATLGVAVANKLTARQLKDTILAHPSVSESIHDALQDLP